MFFFKQKTAYEMRSSDWSSDVCSSDLSDQDERMEAALARRLDRVSRQLDRLEWHVELTNEAIGLFVRFWLTSNPPLPDTAMKAAQAMGKIGRAACREREGQ